MATKPPQRPRRPLGLEEFAGMIGDGGRPGGGTGIYALTRDPRAPAPPAPKAGSIAARAIAQAAAQLQVQSTFDTRPIQAYDFVTFIETGSGDPQIVSGDILCPDGFTMIVRRVEFDFIPAFDDFAFTLRLTADSVSINLNTLVLRGVYSSYGFDTHHVIGQGHTFGVAWEGASATTEVLFRIFGNLLSTRGRPPETEVGSMPLQVRNT